MSRKKNSKLASILIGPILVFSGIMALWENEGRFNYYQAAKETIAVISPNDYTGEPVSYTGNLDTEIPIDGEYVEKFDSFHVVERSAQIYSWEESTDSDNRTTWSKGWHSRLENNSRNRGLQQRLSSKDLYPSHYLLGDMQITPSRIHFVDDWLDIPISTVELSSQGHQLGLETQGDYLYLDKGDGSDLGDERVSYEGIPNASTATYFGVVSDYQGVGKQFEVNTGFISMLIQNDGILHHLVNGEREEALEKIRSDFVRVMWITRIAGTVAIVFGIFIFLSSFMSLLYRIPYVGNMIESGVFLISLVIGLPIALFVILAGLIINNPLTVALPLAIVIGGIVYLLRRSRRTKKNAKKLLSTRLANQKSTSSAIVPPPPPNFTAKPVLPSPPGSPAPTQVRAKNIEESTYTAIEQTFIHLAMMALAEGGLDKKENKLLINYGKDNGIKPLRMKELFAQVKTGEIKSEPGTRSDIELLALMALVDGELSKSEWNMLVKFAEKIEISAKEVELLIDDIENGKLSPI